MDDLVEELKHRARHLHARAKARHPDALAFLRDSDELRTLNDAELAQQAQRRHALGALARILGFSGWPHARAVLAAEPVEDRGTLMHRDSGGAYCNVWSANHAEARAIREAHGGYLLGYRRHFFIVDAPYLTWLGLDPVSPDWDRMGRDWVAPKDRAAWSRVTRAAIAARLDDQDRSPC